MILQSKNVTTDSIESYRNGKFYEILVNKINSEFNSGFESEFNKKMLLSRNFESNDLTAVSSNANNEVNNSNPNDVSIKSII